MHTRKRTRRDAESFIAQSFADAIAWKAARVLLIRAVDEGLTDDVRAAIARFLERHPDR